ncbi:MAG: hypothetical protein ACJ8F7_04945 [Gemmataceae bacterium]
MLTRIYAVFGGLVLLLYGVAAVTGYEIGTLGQETPTQAAARHAAGGHRAHTFWLFRGGK